MHHNVSVNQHYSQASSLSLPEHCIPHHVLHVLVLLACVRTTDDRFLLPFLEQLQEWVSNRSARTCLPSWKKSSVTTLCSSTTYSLFFFYGDKQHRAQEPLLSTTLGRHAPQYVHHALHHPAGGGGHHPDTMGFRNLTGAPGGGDDDEEDGDGVPFLARLLLGGGGGGGGGARRGGRRRKTRRVCEKDGDANVKYKNVSEKKRRYVVDLYTTLVDSRLEREELHI